MLQNSADRLHLESCDTPFSKSRDTIPSSDSCVRRVYYSSLMHAETYSILKVKIMFSCFRRKPKLMYISYSPELRHHEVKVEFVCKDMSRYVYRATYGSQTKTFYSYDRLEGLRIQFKRCSFKYKVLRLTFYKKHNIPLLFTEFVDELL